MGTIMIRNLNAFWASRLWVRAAVDGRTVKGETRDVLSRAFNHEAQALENLGTAISKLFKPFGGFDMPDVPREPIRVPPSFD